MGDRLAAALLAPLPGARRRPAAGAVSSWPGWAGGAGHDGGGSPCGTSGPRRRGASCRALALHVDLGPDDVAGAGLGLVLALLASGRGFRIPVGGARPITAGPAPPAGGGRRRRAARRPRRRASSSASGRAVAVRTGDGDEIPVRRAVLADVAAAGAVPATAAGVPAGGGWARRMRRFRYGWGTFKMDWALSGPVPWPAPEARESAVVHAGDSLADLTRLHAPGPRRRVARQPVPRHRPAVAGRPRPRPGRRPHPLGLLARAAGDARAAGPRHREAFADRIERRLEGLAPGFRGLILGRAVSAPPDLEAMDENLVGGDLGGGSARFDQQLFFRPAFPYFRYRTPVRGLYLARRRRTPARASTAPPGSTQPGRPSATAATATRSERPAPRLLHRPPLQAPPAPPPR